MFLDYAKSFLEKGVEAAIKNKKRPIPEKQLGITTISITQDIVKDMLVQYQPIPSYVNQGVFVWKVMKGTPAHK